MRQHTIPVYAYIPWSMQYRMRSTSASPPSPLEGKALIVPIKLAGTGSYPDLARFLHSLRETFRDTAITTLKLTAQPAAPNPARTSENVPAAFTIDLAWYAAPAGSADAPANP